MKTYKISCRNTILECGKRTLIMGILNVTPDSFSDGGKYLDKNDAVLQAEKMISEGADIIDIGGESSRPFSDPVSLEEELKRVIPVIEHLSGKISVPISVDTTKSEVAEKAIAAGASIVNDISAFRVDPEMVDVIVKYQVPVILMHMKGSPKTMQENPQYDHLIPEIIDFLKDTVDRAVEKGVKRDSIIVDPGIGFGKTFDHNLMILKHLREFESLDVPILVGSSRKAFIRNILKDKIKEDFRDQDLHVVEGGTQVTVSVSILNGAHIVRVHDVASTFSTVKVIDAIKNV